jgi:hypothetical protein
LAALAKKYPRNLAAIQELAIGLGFSIELIKNQLIFIKKKRKEKKSTS